MLVGNMDNMRNFYVADPEGNLLEIGSANAT